MSFVILIILLLISALFSGLTLGMMGLGPHDLKRKADLGDKQAAKIYPIRKKGNLLLVTLVIGNVAVNAAISIFMGSLASGLMAGIISTILITVFGEIAPQALFARFSLEIGSRLTWLVRIVMFIFYPVAAPLAYALDKVLGEELPTVFSKRELREMLVEHASSTESDIQADESRIARGAFTFAEKTVAEVMIPRLSTVTLREDEVLTQKTILAFAKHGYSRMPVLDSEGLRVKGILYAYDLLDAKNKNKKVSEVCDSKVYYVNEHENLDHVLNAFLKKKHHLFIVIDEFEQFTGVITIEDILEQIIGKEIVDEFDEYENIRKVALKKVKGTKA